MKQLDTKKLLDELRIKLQDGLNETQIIETKNTFIHKYLLPIHEQLRLAPVAEKKDIGNFANIFKNEINQVVEEVLAVVRFKNENLQHQVNYDTSIDNVNLTKGGLTPISLITNDTITFFKNLNFQIISGNEVVPTEYNFDRLNIDVNHPGRSEQDSFFLNPTTMLRAHCTAVTSQVLENNKNNDIRIVTFGNVYRNDDDDATHSHQFNQVDIVWVRDNLNIQNLKWLISSLLKHVFNQDVETRFRLSYFPFTEPSFEVDVSCIKCGGKGCPLCKQTGWIEILGAGMLHENVLQMANINIKTGLAAGIGLDRLAMLKYGITDIRDLYSNDFRILNQFKVEV